MPNKPEQRLMGTFAKRLPRRRGNCVALSRISRPQEHETDFKILCVDIIDGMKLFLLPLGYPVKEKRLIATELSTIFSTQTRDRTGMDCSTGV